MNEKDFKKELEARNKQRHLESLDANKDRAHSISIGHSSGGTTEINMRTNSGKFIWNVYQPVEVVEILYQLAASIGCHIDIQPRNDFASWRQWKKPTEEEHKHLNGHAPFAKYVENDRKKGMLGHEKQNPSPEQTHEVQEKENVATKKAVNKRTTKRSRTSTK